MRYILFLKDNIAIAKGVFKDIGNVNLYQYDRYEEIKEKDYLVIELPAIKVGDNWMKTDKFPFIEYPKSSPENTPVSDIEQLRADIEYIAIMEGIEL